MELAELNTCKRFIVVAISEGETGGGVFHKGIMDESEKIGVHIGNTIESVRKSVENFLDILESRERENKDVLVSAKSEALADKEVSKHFGAPPTTCALSR